MEAKSNTNSAKAIQNLIKDNMSILFFVIVFVASILFVPKFGNPSNIYNIFIQSSDLIILACGTTYVFVNGSLDFSVTAILPLTSVLGAMVMRSISNPVVAIILAIIVMLLVALAIGAINGIAVANLRMPSFMATMATQLIFSGIALFITQSNSISGLPNAFIALNKATVVGIQVPFIIAIIVVVVLAYTLNCTVYGRQMVAVGINQQVAQISGINVKKKVFSVFIVSAVCSAIASMIMTARLGSGVPALGKDMLMDIVAAVVIGGTSNVGGSGKIIGSVFGALIVQILSNALNLLGLDWYYITACKGLLIVALSLLNGWRKNHGGK